MIQPTTADTPFDEHGRNYMEKEPNLPSPMMDTQDVADAILDAALTPRRDVKVGVMSKVNTFVANNLGSVADVMASKMEKKFKRDEPLRNPQGTLNAAGESGRTHGRHPASNPA